MDEDECCPKFSAEAWDGKTFEWKNKMFIRDSVSTAFYIPLNFGKVMRRVNEKVENAGGKIPDWLCLSEHVSGWKMNVYLAADKEIPGADNVALSGKFLSKVYEGPFKDAGKWSKDFEVYAKDKNISVEKQYMWYTTCPKCAKKYGKNYVVIIGKTN